jgi:replicative DNA helicase
MSQMRALDDDIRVPPHDIQAEMCVLGSMSLSADAVYLARNRLEAASFYNLAHQDIFSAMLSVADENKAIDPIVLRDELERSQKLEAIGGMSYIIKIAEATPTSGNAEHYIEIVRENALRRHLISTAGRISERAYLIHEDADAILDEAEREVLAVRDSRGDSSIKKAPDVLLDVMDRLEETRRNPGQLVGLDTGFHDINDLIGGLRNGEMIILAARPSQGKTSLALNILHTVCFVNRRPALFFSLEMSPEQIVSNFLCMHNKIDTKDLREGTYSPREERVLRDSLTDLEDLPLLIDDTPSLEIMELRARARRAVQHHGVQLVVVDYLQLMTVRVQSGNNAIDLGLISQGLKSLARELNIPVLAVAQLNRDVEQHNSAPKMSHLRGSGSLEQDADVVLLLHRPNNPAEQDSGADSGAASAPPGSETTLIVAKNRNGPVGRVPLVFIGKHLLFRPRLTHAPNSGDF